MRSNDYMSASLAGKISGRIVDTSSSPRTGGARLFLPFRFLGSDPI
jgi:hypothetical protein